MIFGALLFWLTENKAEFERQVEKIQYYELIRKEFLTNIKLTFNDESLEEGQRDKLFGILVEDLFEQLDIPSFHSDIDEEEKRNKIKNGQEWTFVTAMYFSGTLFTTIGYGDIACETNIGQIGTVIYSIIGIPLMLITLNELGKFLYKTINELMACLDKNWQKYFLNNIRRCLNCAPKKSSQQSRRSKIIDSTKHSLRSTQKELERKATHFFKDQRIAQREIFDHFDARTTTTLTSEDLQKISRVTTDSDPVDNLTKNLIETGSINESHQDNKEEDQDSNDQEDQEVPRMHVLVAITFTVSWVLFCAALFKHVEDWTYSKSLYFVCISLLTVGLGDVKVSRRGYMLIFFVFVMIGLSLVSMCINVIQNSIEDFYKRLLAQTLENYKQGDGSKIEHNFLAKVLLPLLGKRRKESMMRQMREKAVKSGIELPNTFDGIFDGSKEDTSTESNVSDVEVEIQLPSPSLSLKTEEDEESIHENPALLETPQEGWFRQRRPSFQLDEDQMRMIPYVDSDVFSMNNNIIDNNYIYSRERNERNNQVDNNNNERDDEDDLIPHLKVVQGAIVLTENGEQQMVHSIVCSNSHLP
uniref:Potassium channel domain-containing protein n=1 Tax=Meloidogyne incognita TaxID=6306 RepID=A0A914MK70_MELIC